jgi:hypothetical protein
MKSFLKSTLIFTILIINLNTIACDFVSKNDSSNKEMQIWLGNNSSFSKSYIEGKCALDKALKGLPITERKVIANLIAKSYGFEMNNIKKLQTYNY